MRLAAILGLASLFPAGLAAQDSHTNDASVALRVGSLGIGAEVSKLVMPHIGIRAGGNYFSYNRNFTTSQITYDADLKFKAFTGLVDLYPASRGIFHFTAGVMTRPVTLTGTGVPNAGTFSINQHTYTQAQVGTLDETLEWGAALPYLGLGFGTPAARSSGLGFLFDVGVGIGKPTVTLTSTGASSNAGLQSDLNAQTAKQQKDANKLGAFPVFELGLAYRF